MDRIACIIVTFNRLELLQKCYEALKQQVYSDFDIIVVNNGSTDGTVEWLNSLQDIVLLNQSNLGGSGGFYTGMKYAYENQYDWMWLMDDDGVPDKQQLHILLTMSLKYSFDFSNALVCDIDNPSKLAFGLTAKIIYKADVVNQEYIENHINPFNGTFINRRVIDKIGFIKKEMFIWGDESEYQLRAQKNGITTNTICRAIHNHPKAKGSYKNVFGSIFPCKIAIKPENLSHFYYRNLGFIQSHYSTYRHVILTCTYYIFYFIRTFNFPELLKFLKFYIRGVRNQY